MKFVVKKSALESFNFLDAETIEKARKGEQAANHKYIFRKATGNPDRPYEYIFIEDLIKRPMKMITDFFGVKEKQIEQLYTKLDVKKDYDATIKDLQQHLLEYFCHRDIWDKRFADKTIRDKQKTPIKMKVSEKIIDKTTETPKPESMQLNLFDDLDEPEAETWKANPTLMRKIWGLYSGKEIDRLEENKTKVEEKIVNAEPQKEDREAIIRQIRDYKNFGYTKEKIKYAFENDPMLKNTTYFASNMNIVYEEIENAFKTEPEDKPLFTHEEMKEMYEDSLWRAKASVEISKPKSQKAKEENIKNTTIAGIEGHLRNGNYKFDDDVAKFYAEQIYEEMTQEKAVKTEAEKHQARSEAMRGNQNARKYGLTGIELDDLAYLFNQHGSRGKLNEKSFYEAFGLSVKAGNKIQKKIMQTIAKERGMKTSEYYKISFADVKNAINLIYNEYITYNGGNNNGENQTNIESTGISGGSENIRTTGRTNSNENVSGPENGSNPGELSNDTLQSGIGPKEPESIDYDYFRKLGDGSGKLTDGQAKKIRDACKKILDTKTDEQITEADKAVLSMYVGAGGRKNENDKSNKAVLSEYYTPRKIVNKIWHLVDKYLPQQNKTCIESSSGIGRFAEGRQEKFTMFEYDTTSARIAKILHPEAEVVQGEFEKNWIREGRFNQKNFEKFDCSVGNPPYMEHSGVYAGMGEGKEFKRAESYFIDRTLKTLKENGVLAMVIPSGMLNSNGKTGTYAKDMTILAKECELLEAWRLPSESFDKTNIGTDIIVLRKKAGGSDVNDFINGNYFKKNPTHICGDVVKEPDWRGNIQEIVRPHNGETIEMAIDSININDIEAIIKELPKAETVITDNAEKNKKISEALKGNKNAVGKHNYVRSIGKNLTTAEFNEKYGKSFDPKDIEVWKNTDWNGNIDLTKLTDEQKTYIENSDNYVKEGERYTNIVNFASGNIRQKLDDLEELKQANRISDDDYTFKKSLLDEALPAQKDIGQFTVSPIADWTIKYKTKDNHDLINGFIAWAFNGGKVDDDYSLPLDSPITSEEIPPVCSFKDVMDYINKIPCRASVKDGKTKKDQQRTKYKRSEGRRDAAEKLFNRYLQEGLSIEDQKDLVESWNKNFNSFVNPDYTKIPVFIDGMNEYMGTNKFTLTPQQIKGITFLINKGSGLLAYDVGVGKALANSEKVLTPNGWVKNGSLKVGDYVIGDDGKPAQIENVFPQGVQDIYEVTFSDGAKVRCTKEHLWNVQLPYMRNSAQSKDKSKFNTVELQNIMNKLHNARGNRKYSIPMCKPIEFEKKDLLIDPYLMGVLLGDGSLKTNKVGITSEDEFILNKITPMLQNCELKYAGSYDYRISYPYIDVNKKIYNPIVQAIKKYGLENHKSINKFIPQDYLFSSVDDRIELLRGLLDTDGYVKKDGTTTIYYSISENLVRDIRQLVMSLGGTVSITEKTGKYKKNNEIIECKKCYVVTIKLDMINPFSLPRKAELYVNKTKYKPVRYIDSVKLIGKEEASCIWINNKSHLYITNDYVVTHNTVTGLCATINQIQTGRAKRPLICVPNAVYENWIAEIGQHFPDIKINELKNLGTSYMPSKDWKPEEGTLSICTYEGLMKMTFHEDTLKEIHEDVEFAQLQTSDKKKSDRKIAQEGEKIDEAVGRMAKTGDEYAYFEDMGFDHITVDEIHNFKNIFRTPSKLEISTEDGKKAEADEFRGLSGTKSDRGEKLFAISQYIQRHNNNRNVFGLSATPFQNSPIEIYNILSLFARKRLKELGIYSLQEFVKQFALLKSEYAITATDIKEKMVMKSFNNLTALQNLIAEYIDKVDGGEAHVIRPRKEVHTPRLEMTETQKMIMKAEAAYIEAQSQLPKDERDPGSTLNSLNTMRMATLAPGLVSDERYEMYRSLGFDVKKPSDKEFVESSPKLKFVCDSVIKAYKNNAQNGQVIYMPRGVSNFDSVINYLVKNGVPRDAIADIVGGDNSSEKKSIEREDKIHEFNDVNGKCKILLGSENIKEGVNLNGNSTVLYNTMLGWNPTETTQVEGRIWRQGNRQGITHIVYPLLNDSIDPMMYQKYDEKKSRIDSLFSYKGDTMNVDEIDPEEMKFGLIKDPEKRADLRVKQEKEKAEGDQQLYAQMIDVLHKQKQVAFSDVKNSSDYKKAMDRVNGFQHTVDMFENNIKTYKTRLKVAEASNDSKQVNVLDRQIKGVQVYIDSQKRLLDESKKAVKKLEATQKAVLNHLAKRGIHTLDQAEKKIMEYTKLMDEARDRATKADELKEVYLQQAIEENKKNEVLIPSLSESVEMNVNDILSNLHPMDEEFKAILTAENEAQYGVKKSLFYVENGRIYMRRFVKKSAVETVIL